MFAMFCQTFCLDFYPKIFHKILLVACVVVVAKIVLRS